MDAFVRPRVGAATRALEARWYHAPDVFEAERERIFARDWICVGRTEQLERAGDFVVAEIAGESIIVTRGADAQLRAFYNVCRHRGTRLCAEPAGRFGGSIQCPYHAWTYALDGTLTAARTMAGVPGFKRTDYPQARSSAATRSCAGPAVASPRRERRRARRSATSTVPTSTVCTTTRSFRRCC